jgi:uncharacterized protein YecT (DUF1311 family)
MALLPVSANADDSVFTEATNEQTSEQTAVEDPCVSFQTQDERMNVLYQAIKKQYADDKQKIRRLRKAQKNWLRFRDSHLALLFPTTGQTLDEYASVTPMCRCYELAALTQARNVQLNALLQPEEGDVCATR